MRECSYAGYEDAWPASWWEGTWRVSSGPVELDDWASVMRLVWTLVQNGHPS